MVQGKTNDISRQKISVRIEVKAKRLLFVVVLALLLIPAAALAVDYTVSDGETFSLNVCSSATSDTVTVAANATATLTGSATGVPVSCEAGVTLTISGVSINTSASSDTCALSFTGAGNTLILSGSSTIKSGKYEPGIRVESSTKLLIYGDGSLDATGGEFGAGIGGGYESDCGAVTIPGGTVTATGGPGSAGIGGGTLGSGGTIEISGGTVKATGGSHAAGIGGGWFGSGGTLTISNTAAVFLENNTCISPSLPDGHENKTPSDTVDPMIFDGNEVYGLTVPSAWTTAQGGYFRLLTVTYDANGGEGTPPDSPPVQHIGTGLTVAGDSGGMTKYGYILSGWNTQADGSGATYAAGTKLTLTSSMTLYALWGEIPQTGDDHAAPLPLFAGLALASLLGMAAFTISKRRKRISR